MTRVVQVEEELQVESRWQAQKERQEKVGRQGAIGGLGGGEGKLKGVQEEASLWVLVAMAGKVLSEGGGSCEGGEEGVELDKRVV
jgi:hypothetical protein